MQNFPDLCVNFNKGQCYEFDCDQIHLCKRLVVFGLCEKGSECKFRHTLRSKDAARLSLFGIRAEDPNWLKYVRSYILEAWTNPQVEYDRSDDRRGAATAYDCRLQSFSMMMMSATYSTRSFFSDQSTVSSSCSSYSSCSTTSTCASNSSSQIAQDEYDLHFNTRMMLSNTQETINRRQGLSPVATKSRSHSPRNLIPDFDSLAVSRRRSPSPLPKQVYLEKVSKWFVCSDYLNNSCPYPCEKCPFLHPTSRRPYKWFFKFEDGVDYFMLDDSESDLLEMHYADPDNTGLHGFKIAHGNVIVDVLFMNYVHGYTVPDRSLIKFFRAEPREGNEDLWTWCVQTDNGEFKSYDELFAGRSSKVESVQLEKTYRKMRMDTVLEYHSIKAEKEQIVIIMKKCSDLEPFPFVQKHGKTFREVIRRPKFAPFSNTWQRKLKHEINGENESHQVCRSHPTKPCKNSRCPFFNYKGGNYLWLAKFEPEHRWSQLGVNEARDLELKFVNPKIVSASLVWEGRTYQLKFENDGTVRYVGFAGLEILRLCYDEDKWMWYYQHGYIDDGSINKHSLLPRMLLQLHERKTWKEFESEELEFCYRQQNASSCKVDTVHGPFEVHFHLFEGKYCNQSENSLLEFRRRPAPDKGMMKDLMEKSERGYPPNWCLSGELFVPVLPLTFGYTSIANLLANGFTEIQIRSVENLHYWNLYKEKRSQMIKKLGVRGLNEAILMHGTKRDALRPIAEHNFDFRLAGSSVGSNYGTGSYFTPNVSTALCYSSKLNPPPSPYDFVVIAVVLMGEYCVGAPGMKRPPNRLDKPDELFDSCVDNMANPDKIVVFDNNQTYPLYVCWMKRF